MNDEHPYPQLNLVHAARMSEMESLGEFAPIPTQAEPRLDPYTLEPIQGIRSEFVPPPDIRAPALLHYPRSRDVLIVPSSSDVLEYNQGFGARAIVVQNVGSNAFLFCPELSTYLTVAPTPVMTFNLPVAINRFSIRWHTAVGNPATPVAVPNQYAIIWLYDEWVPPLHSGGAGNASAVTILGQPISVSNQQSANVPAITRVAQNIASVNLLVANGARRGIIIHNDTAANLFVNLGIGAASAINYSYKIPASQHVEFPLASAPITTGLITGIWDAAGAGAATVTEIT